MNYNRIKELLAKSDRSSNELAAFMGVKPQTVSTWCTNSNQPEVPTLFKIAEFLGVEARELLTEKKDLKPAPTKKVSSKKKGSKKR